MSKLELKDRELIEKYGERSFMYTEYPNWRFWSQGLGEREWKRDLRSFLVRNPKTPLMLYVHVPHCHKQCLFCTCYVKITRDYDEVKKDVAFIFRELELLHQFFDKHSITPNIREIHLGGGSPTYLHEEEFEKLITQLGKLAKIYALQEFAIEIDPRHVKEEGMKYYYKKGINRISFGVQDFDAEVQQAVDRIQPAALTQRLLAPELRRLFKNGVNFDIICGLPRQTVATMRRTIEKVVELSPDRICLNYMHFFPEFYPHQYTMPQSAIPKNMERKELFLEALHILLANGYVRIGYDHFAKPLDALSDAEKNGTLNWNRLGPTPGRVSDVLAVGYSGVSSINFECFYQNYYDFHDYQSAIDAGRFPVFRGHVLSRDDAIRMDVIHTLRNYFALCFGDIEKKHAIEFRRYFKDELNSLNECVADEIVIIDDNGITITDPGKQFADFVCSRFDAYLNQYSV